MENVDTKKLNEFGTEKLIKALRMSTKETQKEVIGNWKRLKKKD